MSMISFILSLMAIAVFFSLWLMVMRHLQKKGDLK